MLEAIPAGNLELGGLSVQEYDDGSTTPTVEYIRGSDYGGGIGGVLYTIRDGAPTFNSYNSRGDVVSQTDDLGATTWQASYEAFGTRTQEEGDTEERQKANTKDEDPTGLLNEHHRYRDLVTGAFITRDPLSFVDGPNVYTYVRQNPWTFFDPLGLRRKDKDGFEWSKGDHHKVSVKIAREEFDFTSKGAKEIFDTAKIKTAGRHDMTLHGHVTGYSAHVRDEAQAFLKAEGINKKDIGGMSARKQKKLAQNFVNRIDTTKNKFIKGFNSNVHLGKEGLQKWVNKFAKNKDNHKYIKPNLRVGGKALKLIGFSGNALQLLAAPAAELRARNKQDHWKNLHMDAYGMKAWEAQEKIDNILTLEQHYIRKNMWPSFTQDQNRMLEGLRYNPYDSDAVILQETFSLPNRIH